MDKFGIFKLLSGFFDLYKNTPSNDGEKSINNSENPAQNLINSLFNNSKSNVSPTPVEKKPLQSQMLSTMKNHDEFVKRVKENLKK